MYGMHNLQSTPVASKYPSIIRRLSSEHLPTNFSDYLFSSASDATGNCSFFDDFAISTLSRFHLPCRHSLRLLTNGYYIYDEDSILSDDEGNLTLSPTNTSVTYKERLVRIFRKKRKRINKSLASIFSMKPTASMMVGSVISHMDQIDGCATEDGEDSDPDLDASLNHDSCEFSHDQRLWTSPNRRPMLNDTRRHFKGPLHACLFPEVQNPPPAPFGQRFLRDLENTIDISPICFIILVLVCLLLASEWETLL